MEQQISGILDSAIGEYIFPGCAVGIVNTDGEVVTVVSGRYTYESTSPLVSEQSIFDVASITKSIPTASLALWLIDQGKLSLADKVSKFLPELANSYRDDVTIWHLLTHTIDFGQTALSAHKDKSPEEILKFILKRELSSPPGAKYWYMNATSILLGLVVEKVAGKPLPVLADEIFFKPLRMTRTTFYPKRFPEADIIPTELDDWRGRLVHGEVHDETAHTLQKSFVPGHAGLFSTVPDLLVFLDMLLHRGMYNGQGYFSETIVHHMEINQLTDIGESAGLGWRLNQPEFMGQYSSAYTFGMIGFTGCMALCDIPKGRAMIMLSNAVHPKRPTDRSAINQVRCDIADIVFKA